MKYETEKPIELTVKQVLQSDTYDIPIYQRNYAWGEAQITQLIQDIVDSLSEKSKNYYLGTLVVYSRKDNMSTVYETIDGQQRLTTLSILTSAIKNTYKDTVPWYKEVNLSFSSRPNSSLALSGSFQGYFTDSRNVNTDIQNAYDLTIRILKQILKSHNVPPSEFIEYLYSKVRIIRVPVPNDTDLNHYFEVMNNRGEQLEKHEILKANMMECFTDLTQSECSEKTYAFNRIWEACSDMERYIQYGFTPDQRDKLFGKKDWNTLKPDSFTRLIELLELENDNEESTEGIRIDEIIIKKDVSTSSIEKEDKVPDRFTSVINFPNFLLQVLRVTTEKDIPLDDKRLLSIFHHEINSASNKIEFVSTFVFNLLGLRFLFDKYIVKREFLGGRDAWSLKRLKWYKAKSKQKYTVSYVNVFDDESENREALMLLSMFHVSTPTQVYKHWLNAALLYLHKTELVTANEYINELRRIARQFVYGRYLSRSPKDHYELIYGKDDLKYQHSNLDADKLKFGQIENNLVFNYVDYLYWKQNTDEKTVRDFEYTFRSSVEHYYPQQPMEGQVPLDEYHLNSFGNLCLISHSKNSKLSNFMPIAKKEYYSKNTIDSIKQHMMMKEDSWDEDAIERHYSEVIELLGKDLFSE